VVFLKVKIEQVSLKKYGMIILKGLKICANRRIGDALKIKDSKK